MRVNRVPPEELVFEGPPLAQLVFEVPPDVASNFLLTEYEDDLDTYWAAFFEVYGVACEVCRYRGGPPDSYTISVDTEAAASIAILPETIARAVLTELSVGENAITWYFSHEFKASLAQW